MRVLFTCAPAPRHLYPVVPLAWAFRSAGHQVLIATPEDFMSEVTSMGLPAVATVATNEEGITALVEDWQPHVVVAESAAVARLGVPLVEYRWDPVEAAAETSAADLIIDACPPALRPENTGRVHHIRHIPCGPARHWQSEAKDRPRVCVVAEEPLAGLEKLDIEIVRAPRLLKQTLPTADVVVHDGDSLIALDALAHGVPQLILPRSAEAAVLAERLSDPRVGSCLEPGAVSASSLAEGVSTLLTHQRFRQRAAALADEIANQPRPAEVVRMVTTQAGARLRDNPAATGQQP